MKVILILLIVIFCLIVGKLNNRKLSFSILIATVFVFSPLVLFYQISTPMLVTFLASLLLCILYEVFNNIKIKKLLFALFIIFYGYSIFRLTGIIDTNINFDIQKTFIIDNSSIETVNRFKDNALYLPVMLRPIVYNNFQIVLEILIKTASYLWIDKLITFLGFAILYLAYLAFKNKTNRHLLLLPLFIIMFSVIHRNPNTQLMYFLSLPILILFFTKNITTIKNPLVIPAFVLINCLYSVL